MVRWGHADCNTKLCSPALPQCLHCLSTDYLHSVGEMTVVVDKVEFLPKVLALPLQQWVSVLFWADCPQKVLNIARLHCHKGMHYSKKFDLVHQTVSPRERMKSGDKAVLIPIRQSQSSCTVKCSLVRQVERWVKMWRCPKLNLSALVL